MKYRFTLIQGLFTTVLAHLCTGWFVAVYTGLLLASEGYHFSTSLVEGPSEPKRVGSGDLETIKALG